MNELLKEAHDMNQKCIENENSYSFPSPHDIEPIIDKIQDRMNELTEKNLSNSEEFQELFELEDLLCDHFKNAFEY